VVPKKLIALSTAASLALGAYWTAAPYLTLYQMKSSVEARDADALNSHINYPALRENLKEQIASHVAAKMAKEGATGEKAALGTKLALGLSGALIDNMVTPEAVKHAMTSGDLGSAKKAGGTGAEPPSTGTPDFDWNTERVSANRLLVHVKTTHQTLPKQASLVLAREGFATWKVVGVVMPEGPLAP